MQLNRIINVIKKDGIKKVVQRKIKYIYNRTFYEMSNRNAMQRGGGMTFEEFYPDNHYMHPLSCTSQICNQEFYGLPFFHYWMDRLKLKTTFHRKQWEWAYITQVLYENGFLKPGKKGLVFGVGTEPLPALFASMGCEIWATDLDIEDERSKIWKEQDQHSGSKIDVLNRDKICPEEIFDKNVHFENVDMNNIPTNLRGFDFNWSSCALEHIGGLEKSFDFIQNQLETLRPGGLAVHTTEFNLTSDSNTNTDPYCYIFRKRDILEIVDRLTRDKHYVYPIDWRRGTLAADRFVDIEPYKLNPHLRLLLTDYVTTSIGLIIKKNEYSV